MTDKIKISWDDIHSVPQQSNQVPVAGPSGAAENGESWGRVASDVGTSHIPGPLATQHSSILYRSWFYLGMAGLIAGFLAWGLQELVPTQPQTSADYERMFEEIEIQARQLHPEWDQLSAKRQAEIGLDILDSRFRRGSGFMFALVGAVLAAGLGMADGIVSRSATQATRGGGLGLIAGAIGGFAAGVFAQWLYTTLRSSNAEEDGINSVQVIVRGVGWAVAGGVIGSAFGLSYLSVKRSILGVVGGFAGGLIGGLLFDWISVMTDSATFSRFIGIVAIGAASGILISLAEQVAKSAWVQIEAGRLIGKQFVIYRNPTRVGALSTNEIYLFKDRAISPEHARIELRGNGYYLTDNNSATGTYINGKAIRDCRLRTGDSIQIGETLLRYGERAQV